MKLKNIQSPEKPKAQKSPKTKSPKTRNVSPIKQQERSKSKSKVFFPPLYLYAYKTHR